MKAKLVIKAKVRFGKLDNFNVGVIRRIIHNLYRENTSPSLKKILLQLRLQLHGAIYRPDSFVLMLRYCANLKAIRYESTSLKRIVADKSRV